MTQQLVHKVSYDLKVWFMIVFLIAGLTLTTFYLKQNFFTKNLIILSEGKKTFYLYEPPYLKNIFDELGMNFETYQVNIEKFIRMNALMNLNVKRVKTLDDLDKSDMLILLDSIALSKNDKDTIAHYVEQGGSLLFNSYAAFRNEDSKLLGDEFINKITDLSLSKKYGYLNFSKDLSISPKLLSPTTQYLQNGQSIYLITYDALPIFLTPKALVANLYYTNWAQVSYPLINKKIMPKKTSGVLWNGTYGKGKWVYFSFPLYTFFESMVSNTELKNLYHGMVDYLNDEVLLKAYPYLDATSVSFVSQDTEYRYESLRQFSDLALKYEIPVTALCVADLAQKNPELMAYVKKNSYLYFGSHSYFHNKIVGTSDEDYKRETQGSKQLIEKMTGKTVYGFRAPREEIDDKMFNLLEDGGYHYVLNKTEDRLYPYFLNQLMVIPRHATDDYSYLVNLDWTPQEITANMIKESKVIQSLNGIYSMSTHTHLMNFSSNISILEGYFKYLKTLPGITSMTGEMIYNRVSALKNISLSSTLSASNILISIANGNKEIVSDFTFRVYCAHKEITVVSSEIIGTDIKLSEVSKGVYDISLEELKPNSKILLFANYIDAQ